MEWLGSRGLIQGAVQRGCIRDEQTKVAYRQPCRQLDGNANIAGCLLPGTDCRLDRNGVAGMGNVARNQTRGFQLHLHMPGNGLDMKIDFLDRAVAAGIGINPRKTAQRPAKRPS